MKIFDFNRYLNVYIGSSQICCKMNKGNESVILEAISPKLTNCSDINQLNASMNDILSVAEKQLNYEAVNVVLADPFILHINLTMPTIPRNREQLRTLILLKIEKDYQLEKNDYVFYIQKVKTEDRLNRFIIYAVKNKLLSSISKELEKKHKVLRSVIPSYQLIHNSICKSKRKGSGVLLYLDKESWTLSIVDKNNEVIFLRSKWHDNNTNEIFDSLSAVLRSLSSIEVRLSLTTASFIGDDSYREEVSEYLNSVIGTSHENLNEKMGLSRELLKKHADLIYCPILAYR